MLFVLRSEHAPTRIVRETDEQGVERTFWLWRHGMWVVAQRYANGSYTCANDPTLAVTLHVTGSVVVVAVKTQPMAATIPAPPLDDMPSVSISSVIPVATRFEPDGPYADAFGTRSGDGEVMAAPRESITAASEPREPDAARRAASK